jgi:hypothetical protein
MNSLLSGGFLEDIGIVKVLIESFDWSFNQSLLDLLLNR